jgi:hypothetical protein
MSLEWLARHNETWRVALQKVLFKPGEIVEHGEQARKGGGEALDG